MTMLIHWMSSTVPNVQLGEESDLVRINLMEQPTGIISVPTNNFSATTEIKKIKRNPIKGDKQGHSTVKPIH